MTSASSHLPEPPPEPPPAVPPPEPEWILAAMIGIGIALGAAGAIAFVESTRYAPAPPAEAGAHEWGTPASARSEIGSGSAAYSATSAELPDLELEEPVIDVEIRGSSSHP